MYSKEEQLIHELYNSKVKDDEMSRDFAQLINSVINDTLSGEKYLNELLQNADDQKSPSVQFILVGEYLIYKHQGQHFDEEDVRGISRCANASNRKKLDSSKTGNKGIGFKAVFSMASKVSIISKGYCFSFDEHHAQWQGKPENFPWPIIPIPTNKEDYPEAVKKHYDDHSVHFIFRIRKSILPEINSHLQKLTSNKLLFLRTTKELTIIKDSAPAKIIKLSPKNPLLVQATDTFKLNEIKLGDQSSWYLYETQCSLPVALQTLLANAQNIPDKYKSWKTIPIALGMRVKEGRLSSLVPSDSRVFCYLPTEIDFGLKFVVNAEFMLDSSRMQLRTDPLADAWNGFILESIFRESVQFLSTLSINTPQWPDVMNLLSPASLLPQQFERFKPRCISAFNSATDKLALISNLSNEQVYTIKSSVIDFQGFIAKFGTTQLQMNCAHESIVNKELMRELGAQKLTLKKIIEYFATPWLLANIKEPKKNREFIELIKTLYYSLTTSEQNELKTAFQNRTFVLSDRNQLEKSGNIYFPDERLSRVLGGFAFLNSVHVVIEKSTLKDWLSIMGVATLNLAQIIEKANLAKDELIKFTLHLASSGTLFNDASTKKSEMEQVKILKVRNAEGKVVSANECYLPDIFNPETKIERFVGTDSPFLLMDYAPDLSRLAATKAFLAHMGVNQSIELNNLAKVVKAVNEGKQVHRIIKFTQWVFTNFYLNKSSDDQKKLVSILKALLVVNASQETTLAHFCYLPDKYKPAHSFETMVAVSSKQLSSEYIENDADVSQWHDFFVALGAREKLVVEVFTRPYISPSNGESLKDRDPMAITYMQYLKNLKEKENKQLYPSATASYMHQHYLEGAYVKIEFIQEIFRTAYFWQLLHTHWNKFGASIASVSYETARSSTPVPSNIHYWVSRAVQEHYGADKVPSDFYAHAIKECLGDYAVQCAFKIADITAGVTLEQSAVLGFRPRLTKDDCFAVLAKISEAGHYHDDMNKIIFIYQQLLHYVDETGLADDSKINSVLPNQQGTFLPASQLLYIVDDLLPDSDNEFLIKKPEVLTSEEFQKICTLLGVTIVHFNDCTINIANTPLESQLISGINEKLHFILCLEAYTRDWLGASNIQNRISLRENLREKLSKISSICADSLQVQFGAKLDERVELWIDADKLKIFHNPHEKLGHQEQRALYRFLHGYLTLKVNLDNFLYIMTSPVDQIRKKYNKHLMSFDVGSFSGEAPVTCAQTNMNTSIVSVVVSEVESKPVTTESTNETVVLPSKPNNNYNYHYNGSSSRAANNQGDFKRKEHPVEEDNEVNKKRLQTSTSLAGQKGLFFSERFTKAQRYEIGYRGEEVVYNQMKQKHIEKYGADTITDTSDGYTINRGSAGIKTVHWKNKRPADLVFDETNYKMYESFNPYDFEVEIVQGQEVRTRELEVKTTTATETSVELSCSKAEWQEIIKNSGKHHRLFVVRANIAEGAIVADPNSVRKKNLMKEYNDGHVALIDFMRIKLI
ncbi:MAG: hypothetical protein WC627_00225 [Legionella sp.]|jgi:hypothetical protein